MNPLLNLVVRLIAAGGILSCLACGEPKSTSQQASNTESRGSADDTQPPLMDVAQEVGLDFHHHNGMDGSLYYSEMMGGGVALFDYDRDGDLDVYLTQGHDLRPGEEGGPIGRLYRNELLSRSKETPGELRFTDVTAAADLADVPGYGMGVVVLDLENDGWPDLYITQTGPNRLLRNRGDGTFDEIGGDAGVDLETWSVPAVAIDVDGDGWQDLFVGDYVDYSLATNKRCTDELGQANYCGPLAYPPMADRLLRNRGDGTFEDISQSSGISLSKGRTLGALSGDFDGDGRPDFYVANDGTANHLWLQDVDGRFVERAVDVGAAVNGQGMPEASMGVAAGDPDEDGDSDLLLGHLARETNTYFANLGDGTFRDLSTRSGLGPASLPFTTFGVSWLDFDNDGWLDLLTTNGAVKIIKEQSLAGDPHPLRQRNQLFRNRGDGTFVEVLDGFGLAPADATTSPQQVSRGSAVGDVDNDGDIDVVVHNNGGPARLFLNTVGQSKGWLGVEARHGEMTPPGTRLRLQLADGSWRHREVRAGSSYASHDDSRVVFGLGEPSDPAVGAQRLVIHWPDGLSETWDAPAPQIYSIIQRGSGQPWTQPSDQANPTPPEDI